MKLKRLILYTMGFLADREENGLIVQLYSVGHIYGELFYDPHANKILRFRAFDGTAQLTHYLAESGLTLEFAMNAIRLSA